VMRNVTAWQTGPGEISKYDHPSIKERVVRTGAGQWEGGLTLHITPHIKSNRPLTCNHASFTLVGIHTDTVLDMRLSGTVENWKLNGSTMFMFHFYCIEPFSMQLYSQFYAVLEYKTNCSWQIILRKDTHSLKFLLPPNWFVHDV
jgi:hypothetical protein